MTGSGKTRSDWNAALLSDALAPLYAALLSNAAEHMGSSDQYWALWPSTKLPLPWAFLARQLYREVCARPKHIRWMCQGARHTPAVRHVGQHNCTTPQAGKGSSVAKEYLMSAISVCVCTWTFVLPS